MRYSGGGNLTAQVVPVDLTSASSGCESSDFAGFPRGAVALMRRGGCTFTQKALVAEASGAVAALTANDGSPGRTAPISATLVARVQIPVMVISSEVASELASLAHIGPVNVRIVLSVATTRARAANVIADLPGRRPGVVLLGAHLDSVANGPGINDNGSGTALVLEVARQTRRLRIRPRHGLRFAFWGAEELGLVGSTSYVQSLSATKRSRIRSVLNLDMVGSQNFGRLVYSGDGQPSGSLRIESAFRSYFAARGLAVEEVSLGGGSDHAAFARAGIPVGGLFTGADEPKSAELARRFGGEAGRSFDACYHKACDTVANVDLGILDQMADASARRRCAPRRLTTFDDARIDDVPRRHEQDGPIAVAVPVPGDLRSIGARRHAVGAWTRCGDHSTRYFTATMIVAADTMSATALGTIRNQLSMTTP